MIKVVTDRNILKIKSVLSKTPEKTVSILKENFNKKRYLALSAIQLGINDRVAVMWDPFEDAWVEMVDWKIVDKILPFQFVDETCLSLPGRAYITVRYRQITVEDNKGNQTVWYYGDENAEYERCDIRAIAIQQELDHFDGIVLEDIAVSSRDIPIIPEPVNVGVKVGRNEPCPCGSGRKYKHCCLNKKGE